MRWLNRCAIDKRNEIRSQKSDRAGVLSIQVLHEGRLGIDIDVYTLNLW